MGKIVRVYKPAWPYFGKGRDVDLVVKAVVGGEHGHAVVLYFKRDDSTEFGTVLSEEQILDLVLTLLKRLKCEYRATDWGSYKIIGARGDVVGEGFD